MKKFWQWDDMGRERLNKMEQIYLRTAAVGYREEHGAWSADADELLDSGWIPRVPRNANNHQPLQMLLR